MTTLSPSGFLRIGASDLEYRMIGPAPADAPTIVMLHEGLGSAGLWGDFPDRLAAATGLGGEALISGRVAEVGQQITAARAAARSRDGWVMDTYLLRRPDRAREQAGPDMDVC